MFSQAHPAAPGELMEIDSTPLDVLVMLDDGVPGWVELTGLIDVATRTVPAAVLRPSTRSVDASVLLARALTPGPMRPGRSLRRSRAAPTGEEIRFAIELDEQRRRPSRCYLGGRAVLARQAGDRTYPGDPRVYQSAGRRADVTAPSFSVQSNGEAPLGPSAGRLRGNTRP
jgi:hypothetical protein